MDLLPINNNNTGLQTYMEVPDEMDVYMRTESSFLPPGKTWDDLTPEERAEVKLKYRFDCFKPGQFQNISGFGDSV